MTDYIQEYLITRVSNLQYPRRNTVYKVTCDTHARKRRICTRNLLFCICNLRIPVDYRLFYGVFSRACHVTLYTVFLCGYWRLDTLVIIYSWSMSTINIVLSLPQIIRQQYSCTCELTLSTNSHSVILDCTEVYDETLNSDGDSPPLVNSVPSNFVSPSTPFQEMTRLYFYSPPMLPQSSSILNTPDVMEEYTELPSTHHPWAISPSPTHGHMHPPPLSHFNYQ